MIKSDAKLKQHIGSQLERGVAVQLISETRRAGTEGWVVRAQLHADEAAREEHFRSILPVGDELLVVALNPDSGAFGVFQVVKPEPELDFDGGSAHAADAHKNAKVLAEQHTRLIRSAEAATTKCVAAINTGTIKHFEELLDDKPADVPLDMFLSMLSLVRKPAIHLDSLKGSMQLGGQEDFRKTLPCEKIYRVTADVREIDDDGAPNGSVAFKVVKFHGPGEAAPGLQGRKRITAYLNTDNDGKALALLHLAKFQCLLLELSLQIEYHIANKSWEIKVVEILDQKVLIGQSRPVQAVFSEW